MTDDKQRQIEHWRVQETRYTRLCEELVTAAQAGDTTAVAYLVLEAGRQCVRALKAMDAAVQGAGRQLTVAELEALQEEVDAILAQHDGLRHRVGEWLPPER